MSSKHHVITVGMDVWLAGHQDVIMLRLTASLTETVVATESLNKTGGLKHKTDFLSNVPDISFARSRELQIVISLKKSHSTLHCGQISKRNVCKP